MRKEIHRENSLPALTVTDENHNFKKAKILKRDNVDVVGEKCVRNDDGKLTLTVDDKLKAWQSHFRKLLHVEFPWNAANMSEEAPVEGPVINIKPEIVSKAKLLDPQVLS